MEHLELHDTPDSVELALLKKEIQEIKTDLDIITAKLDNIVQLFNNTKAVVTAIKWIGGTILAVWTAFVAVKDHLVISIK